VLEAGSFLPLPTSNTQHPAIFIAAPVRFARVIPICEGDYLVIFNPSMRVSSEYFLETIKL